METPVENFFRSLAECPQPLVLVTVAAVKGSSPGKPGFKMAVLSDGSTSGTVGGGTLEQEAVSYALEIMGGGFPQLRSYKLTEKELGMWCGGEVTLLFEPLGPPVRLWIFGYGHVGSLVYELAQSLVFKPVVLHESAVNGIDCRQIDWASLEPFPEIGAQDYVLALTMDAEVELAILKRLGASPPKYTGVIGSKRKGAKLARLLEAEGIDIAAMNLHIPVGLDIAARSAQEIAVSIIAELIKERNA